MIVWCVLLYVLTVCVCGHQVEAVLTDAKNQLSSEILRRVEMENQVQTLKEQLELQRNISEQVHTHLAVFAIIQCPPPKPNFRFNQFLSFRV